MADESDLTQAADVSVAPDTAATLAEVAPTLSCDRVGIALEV